MTGVAFDFTGAHVLVTGGTSGIGNAIARAFADAGAHTTITGTRAHASDYDTDLRDLTYLPCHLTDSASIEEVAASLVRLDVLVNNAGQNLPGGRSEYEPDVFEEVVAINLFGPLRMARATKPRISSRLACAMRCSRTADRLSSCSRRGRRAMLVITSPAAALASSAATTPAPPA